MGTLLRVLVVIIMLVAIGALYFASVNFNSREALIGRAHALEEGVIRLAGFIEAEDPEEAAAPDFPSRDISPISSRELENPERSDFWNSYNKKYEQQEKDIPTLKYGTDAKRIQLRTYYYIDPATGKVAKDPVYGRPSTKGEGTMSVLITDAIDRAKAQQITLNATRAELSKLREELVNTIEDLNRIKADARTDKRIIEERDARIAQLEQEKNELSKRIASLQEELDEIREQIAELNDEIAKKDEELDSLNDKIKTQEQIIKDLRGKGTPIVATAVTTIIADNMETTLTPGDKGTIVEFNEDWKFAVVKFDDAFMRELLGPEKNGALPQIEVNVRRPGGDDTFVTRLRLRQVIRDNNLVVADILIDWQQAPVKKGDVVYF